MRLEHKSLFFWGKTLHTYTYVQCDIIICRGPTVKNELRLTNEIITGRRVDISGNGCLAVKPEGIINYLINANNDQLKHCVVDIPASYSVTTEEGLEMQIMAKSDD